uniref:Ig-like domain-containing protein n=1 Tax=Oncorhynchus tshawytscha TaxID=74940 RepID=A0AAZ3PJM5_ONCTS
AKNGQYTVTQTPTVKCVHVGQTVALNCQTSSDVYGSYPCLAWYQQKPGGAPKLHVYNATILHDFTLTFSGVQAKNAGDYYCQNYHIVQKPPSVRLHSDCTDTAGTFCRC